MINGNRITKIMNSKSNVQNTIIKMYKMIIKIVNIYMKMKNK